jgi:ring-1,2-phenylacetyl-CoA epoxidase subunit PaaD
VVNAARQRIADAWTVLATVLDPEVPVLSIRDLGIVRDVVLPPVASEIAAEPAAEPATEAAPEPAVALARQPARELEIVLTPTYSGCPATEAIEQSVLDALQAAGLGPARVRLQRAPAWTSDWISEQGRRKLLEYGIAPPGPVAVEQEMPLRFIGRSRDAERLACPRCASDDTERLSAFGATACKALYRCRACREPFEHFKPI